MQLVNFGQFKVTFARSLRKFPKCGIQQSFFQIFNHFAKLHNINDWPNFWSYLYSNVSIVVSEGAPEKNTFQMQALYSLC